MIVYKKRQLQLFLAYLNENKLGQYGMNEQTKQESQREKYGFEKVLNRLRTDFIMVEKIF